MLRFADACNLRSGNKYEMNRLKVENWTTVPYGNAPVRYGNVLFGKTELLRKYDGKKVEICQSITVRYGDRIVQYSTVPVRYSITVYNTVWYGNVRYNTVTD